MKHGEVPAIDSLWGAIESDDDLLTIDEELVVMSRLSGFLDQDTELVDWPLAARCLRGRAKRLPTA